MKKFIYLFIIITVTTIFLNACSQTANTPSAAAENVAKAMQEGNYEAIVDQMNFEVEEGQSAEEIEAQKEMFASLLEEKASQSITENEGIKSYEVTEESISEDGQTANVKVKYTYNNDTMDTETMSFVNKEGKWLLEFDK